MPTGWRIGCGWGGWWVGKSDRSGPGSRVFPTADDANGSLLPGIVRNRLARGGPGVEGELPDHGDPFGHRRGLAEVFGLVSQIVNADRPIFRVRTPDGGVLLADALFFRGFRGHGHPWIISLP